METKIKNRPLVGVGVILRKGGSILLGRRKNSHGDGYWAPPGGHLECGETPEDCAIRETFEETGLNIRNAKRGAYTIDHFKDKDKHYVTLFVFADYDGGQPKNMEPDKCFGWEWFSSDSLPSPLFQSVQSLLNLGTKL